MQQQDREKDNIVRCPKCNSKIEKKINLYTGAEVEIVRSDIGMWFIAGANILKCTDDFKKNNPTVEYFKLHECNTKINRDLFHVVK